MRRRQAMVDANHCDPERIGQLSMSGVAPGGRVHGETAAVNVGIHLAIRAGARTRGSDGDLAVACTGDEFESVRARRSVRRAVTGLFQFLVVGQARWPPRACLATKNTRLSATCKADRSSMRFASPIFGTPLPNHFAEQPIARRRSGREL